MKNEAAVLLGRLSAKARLKGKNKKQRSEAMRAVWEASAKARKKRSLDKKVIHRSNVL